MATHSSVLAWRIPAMGEPGGLPSMGSHGIRNNWSDLAATAKAMIPFLVSGFCVKSLEKQVNSLVTITSINTEKDVLLDNFQGFFYGGGGCGMFKVILFPHGSYYSWYNRKSAPYHVVICIKTASQVVFVRQKIYKLLSNNEACIHDIWYSPFSVVINQSNGQEHCFQQWEMEYSCHIRKQGCHSHQWF